MAVGHVPSSTRSREAQISLLWPPGHIPVRVDVPPLGAAASADLELEDVTQVLTGGDRQRERFVDGILSTLCADPAVITYRQAVFTDLLDDAALRERIQRLLPNLAALGERHDRDLSKLAPFIQVAARAGDLEVYVSAATQLLEALEGSQARSQGLLALRDQLRHITGTAEFRALQAELPTLRARLDTAQSFTIGVNLTGELVPEAGALLSVSPEKVGGRQTVLGRLIGGDKQQHGLTPLRVAGAAAAGTPGNPIYRDLQKLLGEVAAPVAQALDQYRALHAYGLSPLEPEFAFFLNGVALITRLRNAGLPVCCPEPAPVEERATVLSDAYNVSLALRMIGRRGSPERPIGMVTNPITFADEQARIWILTGPNRGGKTTYTQAVGLIHVLFQAGLYVPASAARLSPVDAIHTHFPVPETTQLGMGRLDEEAKRLAGIFAKATPHSLILLNEVLAGTSAVEGLGLALDAVRGLRLLGARAIYTTHLHELPLQIAKINQTTPGTASVGSLVADVEVEGTVVGSRHRRTFRILPGLPRGVSYASEIAEQNGISFGQIAELLGKRGVVDAGRLERVTASERSSA